MNNLNHIINQCIKGDSKSQRALYDHLKEELMTVCFRYSRNLDDAQDVFQETMIRVFKSINKAKKVDNYGAWANRIARNVAIDIYRKNRPEMMVNIDESEVVEFSSDSVNALQQMEADEIIALLQQLPYNQMLVVNLYMIDGYVHKEIAEQLGIAESTSRVLLTRGRKRMMELLKKLK